MAADETPGEKLYKALIDQYTIVRERNDLLVDRAQNLLSFNSIVNTILLALMVALVTNKDFAKIFTDSPNSNYYKFIMVVGFLAYIASVIFALFAYITTKYMPVPQVKDENYIRDVFEENVDFDLKMFSYQAFRAIDVYNGRNRRKYTYLTISSAFLVVAVIATAIVGIFIIYFMI
jgi:hypothetical protein